MSGEQSTDNIVVALASGGSFSTTVSFIAPFDFRHGSFGDVDNDGKIDILMTGNGTTVQAYLHGNGDGTFGPLVTLAASPFTTTAQAIVDINGDGINDIAQTDFFGVSALRVMYGNANGTFTASTTLLTESSGNPFFYDLDNDGTMDILRSRVAVNQSLIYLGNGDGTFKLSATVSVAAGSITGFSAFDMNNDSVLDIMAAVGPSGSGYLATMLAGTISDYELGDVSVSTRSQALETLTYAKNIVSKIAAGVGRIGASQSRIESALRNAEQSRIAISAAESQIRDADIAWDAAELVRVKILQQAGASVLAMANQAPALALKLLR